MGAERKGPLAAFVVIAIIAAILLVTSVRSQAAPGWLDPDGTPASVVAGPPRLDPHLWPAVASGVHQVVRGGVVVVKRATSDDSAGAGSEVALVSATSSGATTSHSGVSGHLARPHGGHHAHGPRHAPRHPGRHQGGDDSGDHGSDEPSAPAVPAEPTAPAAPAPHDHGRHHGWSHGHGHKDGRSR